VIPSLYLPYTLAASWRLFQRDPKGLHRGAIVSPHIPSRSRFLFAPPLHHRTPKLLVPLLFPSSSFLLPGRRHRSSVDGSPPQIFVRPCLCLPPFPTVRVGPSFHQSVWLSLPGSFETNAAAEISVHPALAALLASPNPPSREPGAPPGSSRPWTPAFGVCLVVLRPR